MEAKGSFADVGASTSCTQSMCTGKLEDISTVQEADLSLLASFLQTCMNLLRDKKAVEGLK